MTEFLAILRIEWVGCSPVFSTQIFFFCQKMVTHHFWNDLWNSVSFSKLTANPKVFFIALCLAGGCRPQQQSLLQHHGTSMGFYTCQELSQAFGGQKPKEPLDHLEFGPLLCSWDLMLGPSVRPFV